MVGSGAAGGAVAKELSTAGFSVVVLEQGPYLKEKDFTQDEVKFGYRDGLRPSAADANHSGVGVPGRGFLDSGGEEERNLAGC